MADVSATLNAWSETVGSNAPADATNIGAGLGANLRQIQAVVRQLASSNTISSATTTDLSTVNEAFVSISGTTAITGFGTLTAGMFKWITFAGSLTLTYNGTSLITPSAADIVTQANDACIAESLGGGNWQILAYWPVGAGIQQPTGSVASATTTVLNTAPHYSQITGTTAITAITLGNGRMRVVEFAGALTLTNGASLILPGGANITTAAGDTAIFCGEAGGVVRCVSYNAASGKSVVPAGYGVVGASRAAQMSVTSASATATFTADEIVVESALGGAQKLLSSYSKSCNLATTGAGGMDTGSAPTSGFVSLYAIAKADGTASVVACAVATSSASVYGGANLPSGYTYSALIAIWPTDGSSRFVAGLLLDRRFSYKTFSQVFAGTTGPGSLTSQSISSSVPAAARTASVAFTITTTGAQWLLGVAGDGTGTGGKAVDQQSGGGSVASIGGMGSVAAVAVFTDIPLITAQTIYWIEASSRSNTMYVTDFTF